MINKIIRKVLSKIKGKYKPLVIQQMPNLKVGRMSFHNGGFSFRGDQRGTIGNFCAFGKNVTIITSNHDYNYASIQGTFYSQYFNSHHPGILQVPPNKERTKGDVEIGSDVWISDNVTILSGVKIGNGACIGNNTIVTKNVAPFSIVAGIPGKEIKKRFSDEKIEFLQELAWWNWDESKIRMNKDFFCANINHLSLEELKKTIK